MIDSRLSSAQSARQALADRLKEVRLDAGLSARALSAAAGWHESKTSRIEHATQQPSEVDVRLWCRACSASALTPEVIAQLRSVESMWLDWRRAEKSGLKHLNVAVRDIYERTKHYRSYCQSMVPGLLQTPDYTSAVLESLRVRRKIHVDDVAAAVAERMDRQHILYEGDHRFAFLLEVSALRYQVGGPEILAYQLEHLINVMRLPSVSLGIIPTDRDRTERWPVEDFYIFDSAQANVELVSGFLTVTQPREVAVYAETFNALAEAAVYGAAAQDLIRSSIDELEA